MKLPCQWPCKEWQSIFPTVTPPAGEDIESIEVHGVLFSYKPYYKDVVIMTGVACTNATSVPFMSLFSSTAVTYNGTDIPLKEPHDISHLLVAELEDKANWPCPEEGLMVRMMKCEGEIKPYGPNGLYFDQMQFVYNQEDDTVRYYCNEANKEDEFFTDKTAFFTAHKSHPAVKEEFFSNLSSIFVSPSEAQVIAEHMAEHHEVF